MVVPDFLRQCPSHRIPSAPRGRRPLPAYRTVAGSTPLRTLAVQGGAFSGKRNLRFTV
ncbi:hypothetical protein SXIM_43670 [Streptomyces xiamenensis]|uniref:Uncharacterized protein n=1 Tax=Streptomyces xiamenensis TaxID=408015 RepID=A0A0F7CQ41_9ACTN|nr:hypothetical protein SXIM_43670 [Streptomyces xiamenensis]